MVEEADIPDVVTRFERVLWDLVVRFSHRSITAETVKATGHSLPPASWALLDQLDDGGPMRVGDIAACHGVDVSSVTPRLKSLQAEGLIERSRHEHDGRVAVIAIGDTGREALRRMHAARAALIADALSAEDRTQLTQMVPALEQISRSLQATPASPRISRKEAE